MTAETLPSVIERYQVAHDRHDTDAALSTFHPDATVTDEATTYAGLDRIRSWLDHAATEYTYERTLLGAESLGGDAYIVRNHLAGDFPGGEVDLAYRFALRDGLIERLDIAP